MNSEEWIGAVCREIEERVDCLKLFKYKESSYRWKILSFKNSEEFIGSV